jgi:hypothetical protein
MNPNTPVASHIIAETYNKETGAPAHVSIELHGAPSEVKSAVRKIFEAAVKHLQVSQDQFDLVATDFGTTLHHICVNFGEAAQVDLQVFKTLIRHNMRRYDQLKRWVLE